MSHVLTVATFGQLSSYNISVAYWTGRGGRGARPGAGGEVAAGKFKNGNVRAEAISERGFNFRLYFFSIFLY